MKVQLHIANKLDEHIERLRKEPSSRENSIAIAITHMETARLFLLKPVLDDLCAKQAAEVKIDGE